MRKNDDEFDGFYPSLIAVAVLIACVFLFSSKPDTVGKVKSGEMDFKVIVVDSCEYLYLDLIDEGYLSHKGNCSYCIERLRRDH